MILSMETSHNNGEQDRRSMKQLETTVRLFRYNNDICYVNNINAVFKSFRCPNCDTFFNKPYIWSIIKRHAVIVLKCCTQRTFIKFEKLSLINWALLELRTLVSRNCLKNWLFSIFNRFVI